VAVEDVGLFDHFFLGGWYNSTCNAFDSCPVASTEPPRRGTIPVCRRDIEAMPDTWPFDIDVMAALYDSEINSLLDHCAKSTSAKEHRRSNPYFDKTSKRLTRRLERAYAVASCPAATSANVAVIFNCGSL